MKKIVSSARSVTFFADGMPLLPYTRQVMNRLSRHFQNRMHSMGRIHALRVAALCLAAASVWPGVAAPPPAGTVISNTATSTQLVGASNQTSNTTPVTVVVGPAITSPVISKSFAVPSIPSGGSTALTFVVTNATGNPAQGGVGFIDTLPSGLRLTAMATATLSGAGCTGTVTLTPPSAISVSGLAMTAGTASCQIVVNSITNSLGGNPDCAANPPAFTNGPSSISGLANAINGVTNQCLVVATQNGVLLMNQSANVLPGATFVFPHSLVNGPLADTYAFTVANLAGTFNFSNVQIFPDANGDGIADSNVPAPSA
jgi:hypothetical protein